MKNGIHVASTLLAFICAGCFNSPQYLRSGETLPKGAYAFRVAWTVPIGAPGSMTSKSGVNVEGNLGRRNGATWAGATIMSLVAPQVTFETGLTEYTELGVVLGIDGFGPNLRVPIVRESNGAAISVAASVGVTYRPFAGTNLPLFRAGFDASTRTSGGIAPVLDLYATYGPESYAFPLPSSIVDTSAREGPLGPALIARRTELRLHAAIGLSYESRGNPDEPDKLAPNFAIGVVPYFTPYARTPTFSCQCDDPPVTVRQDWGVAAVVQIGGASKRNR